jgi:hypothetical protein
MGVLGWAQVGDGILDIVVVTGAGRGVKRCEAVAPQPGPRAD